MKLRGALESGTGENNMRGAVDCRVVELEGGGRVRYVPHECATKEDCVDEWLD
jgi:hypothetical protein